MEVFSDKGLLTLVNLVNHQNKENAILNNGKTLRLHKVRDMTSQAEEHRLYYR